MKTSLLTIILLALTLSRTQGQVSQSGAPASASQGTVPTQDTPWAVVSKGANQQVWQRTTYELTPDGRTVPHPHQVVELATGLHYWSNGQWLDSKEEIDIQPDGTAAATNGQHQAYFPGDIYQGVIALITPDGKQLQSRPLGLSYTDSSNTVLIAELTNSVGYLVGSNQVIYPDAFTDFKADLRYTYTKAGFEQDVILRESPLTPESYGLNPATARLQVLTEFFNPPQPAVTTTVLPAQAGITLSDENLNFGVMSMIPGRAFLLGSDAHDGGAVVSKSWVILEGRQFLVEEVPVEALVNELEQLPGPASAQTAGSASASPVLNKVSTRRLLPPLRLAQANTNRVQVAKINIGQQRGLVLDYVTINSGQTNYVFTGDLTYSVSGEYNLSGTTTIEGNTVIKMHGSGKIDIDQNGAINCQTGPYRPGIFTSVNDNSTGEPFGSGSPAVGDVGTFLNINATNVTLHDLRFSYCTQAVHQAGAPAALDVWNCQFKKVNIALYGYNIGLHNVLIGRATNQYAAVFAEGPSLMGEQVTADGGNTFVEADYSGGTVALTNCVVTGQQLLAGSPVTLYTNSTVWLATPSSPIYQTVGAGSYYLTNNSPYRDYGTNNISPTLLAEIAAKTTYAPIVYANTNISAAITLSPQAQRDTNGSPDLGYHYDPLDYVFGGTEAKSNITFTAGTAAGWYDNQSNTGYGIRVDKGATVAFNGTVTAPCWMVRYDTVQEAGNGNWTLRGYLAGLISNNSNQGYSPDASQVVAQFTKFSSRNYDDTAYRDYVGFFVIRTTDCEFWTAGASGYDVSLNYTNCLYFRSPPSAECSLTNVSYTLRNCTVIGSSINSLTVIHDSGAKWPVLITDCAFDGVTFNVDNTSGGNPNLFHCDHNAYLTNANRSVIGGPDDVTNQTSFNWQSNWLGNYYLPSNSPLINHGSVTADQVGLYHFTTQTNQAIEGTSVVDIGYHYVAVDTNGIPLDSNGDGIPDYIEDANGNGLVDNGETNWGLAILVQPASQTVIQGTNVTFTVTAGGVQPINYGWYFNNTNPVPGSTSASLTLTNVQTTNAGSYTVVVTNFTGSITSSVVVLTVDVLSTNTLPYGASGYRYLVVHDTNLFTTFYATNYNDTNFSDGQAAFGTNNSSGCDLYANFKTYWITNSDLLLRRHFYVPPGTTNLTLGLAIDDDAQIYLNGILITNAARVLTNGILTTNAFTSDGWYMHEECASNDELVLEGISSSVWHAGDNLLAVHGHDNMYLTYADVRITCWPPPAGTNQQPPSVQIISPINQTLLARSNLLITATNTSSASSVPISWVEFFTGTNSISYAVTNSSGLYQINWTPPFNGTNVLTALAMGTNGLYSWSAPVTNYVRNLPVVTITNPASGQCFSLSAPMTSTNIPINATAVADGATITNVVFYQGTSVLGVVTSPPYGITWSNVSSGTYTLTAMATDTTGVSGISFPVIVRAEPTNQPPFVYAGPNQTVYLSTNPVPLVGMASDDGLPIGSTLSTTWTNLNGGTNVTFVNPNLLATNAYFWETGVYTLRLSASDGQYTTYSSNTITVLSPNLAPTVNAGTNQTIILAAQYSITNNPTYSSSQSIISSEGKEFWLGFPDNDYGGGAYLWLFISSKTNTIVSVMIPSLEFFTNCIVSAGIVTSIEVPCLADSMGYGSVEVDTDDQIESKGIHVVAQDNISVYGLSNLKYSSDAYCGLPVNGIGTNYIVLGGWVNNTGGQGDDSELLIVGTVKGTTVSITPSVDAFTQDGGVVYPAGTTNTINLNEGQTYQLWGDGPSDGGGLSGTIINANHPIAVFGGSKLAGVPDGYCCGDFLVQQIPPTNTWGQEFFTVPFVRTIPTNDFFQIVAAVNGTTVYANGVPMTTMANSQVPYQFSLAQPCHITANGPILLAQYATSAEYPDNNEDNEPGDPTMMLVPPCQQFLSTYTVSTPLFPTNDPEAVWTNHYVNITVPTNGISSIYLDNTNLNSTLFTNIPGTGYSFAQVSLLPGSHHFIGSIPFGIYMYGFAWVWDGYSYPGGMSLGPIAAVNSITITPQSGTNTISSTAVLVAGVTNQNNQPVPGVRVDFQVGGSNSLSGFAFTDQNGQARFYYTGTNGGVDTIQASVGTNTAAVATNTWAWPAFTLHGGVSDDGLPAGKTNILWSQIAGPSAAIISNSNAANPMVTVTGPGYYVFQLEGDDTQLTNYANVAVSVVQNQAPLVSAGANQTVTGPSANLTGSVTDDGLPNGITNINWSEISGPGTVTFNNPTQAVTTARFAAPGTYVLQLTGSDGQATVSSDVTITVQLNAAPILCGEMTNDNLVSTSFHSIAFTNSYANYYQFTGSYNEQVTVTTTNASFDTYLAIRNSQLQILAEDDDEEVNDTVFSTNSQIIYTLPADGTYVIEVASAVLTNQTGSYTLGMSCDFSRTNGSAAILVLTTNGQSLLNSAGLSFGLTPVGSPVSQTLIITNQGTAPLNLSPFSVSGDFTLTSGPVSLIAPSNSTDLTVQYNAGTNGTETGLLTFTNNDPNNNPVVLNLVAMAIPAGPPPSVKVISPANNVSYSLNSAVPISVSAVAPTGSVAEVDFWQSTPWGNRLLLREPTRANNLYEGNWYGLGAGNYSFVATAIDNAGRVGYSTVVHFLVSSTTNQPPVAVNETVTVMENSRNNILNPLAGDSGGSPLTITLLSSRGNTSSSITTYNGGIATIVNNGQAISYTPPPYGAGADGFTYYISDANSGTAKAGIYINIFASAQPVVVITNPPSGYTTNAGSVVPIVAYVTPSQYITNVDFFLGKVLIGRVTNGINGYYTNFWVANYDDCGCGFTAQATDRFGQLSTSPEININVNPPTNETLIVALDSAVDASGTMQLTTTNLATIQDGLFSVYGRATNSSGSNVVWQVQVYTQDGATLLRNLTPTNTGAVGTATSSNLLAACDLTTLQNGVYDLRLTVSGGYLMANTDVFFRLESNLKLGQFSFSQQDLIIPVNGIPLTVTRTYNSINPDRGDFGYGWTYTLNSMDVSLDESRQNVVDMDGEPFSQRDSGSWDVTLTLPNGQRTTFYFYLQTLDNGTCQAQWQVAPGVAGVESFTADGVTTLETIIGSTVGNSDLDYWDAAPDVPVNAFDFSSFTLKMKDGTRYSVKREDLDEHDMVIGGRGYHVHAYGNPYLQQITELSQDTITINPNSIVHTYANGATSQIEIQRNSDGLITSITDPNGGVFPAVKYDYDNQDNLIYVERLADRSTGNYVTNSFTYTNANFPHFITGIINGDNTQVAKNFYDNGGKLIEVDDANGNKTQFIHNPANNLEMVIDRLGYTNSYVYDLRGNVIIQTNALGQVTTMTYDTDNNKTTNVVYLNGQPYATSYVYDTNSLLLASSDPLGNTNGFTYDPTTGLLLTSTDAKGNTTVNAYDGSNDLISTTDALGHGTTNSYNNCFLVGSVDAVGTITTNYYDFNGNLTNTTTLSAGVILSSNSFTYDDNWNRLTSTVWHRVGGSWSGAKTTFVYDAMNRVVQTIDPDGGTNTVNYDLNGRQQTSIDKLGRTTSYTYDGLGRLIQTTYPDFTTETNGYDANGNRIASADRLGRVTSYDYDALNRLTQTIYPDNTTNTTIYDGVGRVAQTIDARGTITGFSYDAAGRRLAVTNAVGVAGIPSVSSSGYDANGNQIYFTNALGIVTTNVFDALNRQEQVLYPDGTTTGTAYDVAGRRVAETNQDHIVTGFGYDGAGRLTSATNALGTTQQTITRYQYDEAGNEIAQIDALNRVNTYAFDSMGRRVSHTMPDTNLVERFAYDLAGNLVYHTNFNGVIITNQYDVMNRLTNRASVNGYQVSYAYTLTGQRQSMTDPSGSTTYSYDNRDRLLLKCVTWANGPTVLLHYGYDANGNVTNIWSSTANGVNLVYSYDPLSRLTNVLANGSAAVGYGYDLAGNLQTMSYGNGVTNLYQYDSLNRLTSLVWKTNGTIIGSFVYQLGLTGNRTNLSEAVGAGASSRGYVWNYDALYRLTNETVSTTAPTGTLGYGYDSVGNRTNRSGNLGILGSQTPAYNTNDWLKTDAYDNNGNTLWSTNGTVQGPYYYDAMDRLTNYGNNVNLTYNGDGSRASKTVSDTTTYYLLDDRNPSGYAQVLEEYQGSSLSRVYNYGLSLVSQKQGSTTYYFVCDGHGSTRALYDGGGNFANSFAYDAYGNLIASNSTPQTIYLYAGQQFDPDLGLYYNRARYVNPNTGRFWTLDTYTGNNEDPLSLHKYLYCQNNPVNRMDPSGHLDMPSTMIGISIAVGLAAFDMAAVSQVYVNFRKHFGLNDQDRATARVQNNQTMAALQRIIDSGGERTFQQENLGVGGQLGTILPGNGPYQRAANLFESLANVEGYPTALEELFARIATDAFNPLPIPNSVAGTPEKRVELARALLDRSRAFDSWLQREL